MRLFLSTLMLALSVVGAARAEMLDIAASLGSERLTNYTAKLETEHLASPAALQAFVASSARLGFNVLDPNKGMTGFRRSTLRFAPTLTYDGNANGGNQSERLDIGSAVLRFQPESLAQGALLAGVELSATTRLHYGRGRYLDLSAGAGRSFAVGKGFAQTDRRLAVCSRNHVAGWSFVDLCANRSWKDKALSQSDESRVEMGFVQLLSLSDRPAEFRLKAFRQDSSGAWNNGFGIAMLSVATNNFAAELSLESELPSTTQPYESYSVAAAFHTKLRTRPVSIRLTQSEIANARVLGLRHDDTRRTLLIMTPIRTDISISVSYSRTDSQTEFFNSEQFGLNLNFSGKKLSDMLK